MKLATMVLALALAFPAAAAQAADAKGNYSVLSLGNRSCGSWVSHSQPRTNDDETERYASVSWVMGYLSAYNRFASRTGNVTALTDAKGGEVWINNYCQAHPLDTIVDASNALIRALEAKRL